MMSYKAFRFKKALAFFTIFCVLIFLSACSKDKTNVTGAEVIDTFGNKTLLSKQARVVSLYGSFSECWLLSGGELVGVTDDAVSEHNLDVGEAQLVGSVKHINLEKLVELNPDFVILSADLAAHISLKEGLESIGLDYGYFRVDTFDDYRSLMKQFCGINARPDLFEKNVIEVQNEITEIKSKIPKTDKNALLVRAFSTGMKAKSDDNLAGQILKEFGLINIADKNDSMLEDLSLEEIIKSNPDYIFVTTMGNAQSAENYLKDNVLNNPAWQGLKAVNNSNYYILPKNLFHYKPNNRWSESYEYLAKIIWPDIFRK